MFFEMVKSARSTGKARRRPQCEVHFAGAVDTQLAGVDSEGHIKSIKYRALGGMGLEDAV